MSSTPVATTAIAPAPSSLPPARPAAHGARDVLPLALGGAALLAVAAGAASPWVVLFAGLRPMPGFLLEGGPLAAVAVAALMLPLVAARLGGARLLTPLAVLAGLYVAVSATLEAVRIDAFVADPGAAGPLSQPTAGPGAWLMAGGGLLVALAAATTRVRHRPMGREHGARLALATLLYVAAAIHLLLTPEHLGEATLLGLGFLAAGLVQLALAAVVVLRTDDLVLTATVAVTVALIGLYLYAVLVGLPFGRGDDQHDVGVVIGAGEPVDWWGFVDLLAEVGALAVVGLLWPRHAAVAVATSREGAADLRA